MRCETREPGKGSRTEGLAAGHSSAAGRYNFPMPSARAGRGRGASSAPPASSDPPDSLLGGLHAAGFLRRHWQKAPLLVRAAIPGFEGLLTRAEVFDLASRDDVEARLVQRQGSRWSLAHGPFSRAALRALPQRDWTLLVQGINLHVPEADALLRRFSFIPYARLDDVMVSYAAPGGGVGPHLDAYDVFLLQGFGRRRWRYGAPQDDAFRPGLPLRILRRFAPTDDAVLAPGDMLYLPPHFAHDGVALDACTTYSIGFRAPSATEIAAAFLQYLQDEVSLPGRYADPDLTCTDAPARIGSAMLHKVQRTLREVRWNGAVIARFLGTWLSEPKASVFFDPPEVPLSAARFGQQLRRDGARLDPRTQLLYDDAHFFINGAAVARDGVPAANARMLEELANARGLAPPVTAPAALLRTLHEWYRHGYLHLGTTA